MNTEVELLDVYLKELRLSSFRQNHESFAADAAHQNSGYTRFLLALAEAEVQQREANRRKRHFINRVCTLWTVTQFITPSLICL